MQRGGSVLIPSFALGRTQEMLAMLALLMQAGRVRKQPVYIGGLGRVFTEIYDLQSHRGNRHHPDLQLNEALNLIVLDPQEGGADQAHRTASVRADRGNDDREHRRA